MHTTCLGVFVVALGVAREEWVRTFACSWVARTNSVTRRFALALYSFAQIDQRRASTDTIFIACVVLWNIMVKQCNCRSIRGLLVGLKDVWPSLKFKRALQDKTRRARAQTQTHTHTEREIKPLSSDTHLCFCFDRCI